MQIKSLIDMNDDYGNEVFKKDNEYFVRKIDKGWIAWGDDGIYHLVSKKDKIDDDSVFRALFSVV